MAACRYEAFCLVAGKITSHGRQWRGDGWRSADGSDLARGAGRLGSAGREYDDAVAAAGEAGQAGGGRRLPPHVMVYFVMAMALFADDDDEEVAAQLAGTLAGWGCWDAAWSVPTSGGITRPGSGRGMSR